MLCAHPEGGNEVGCGAPPAQRSRMAWCRQQEWAPFTLILAVAEPPKEWAGIVRHIKVFTIQAETRLDEEFFRSKGARLQDSAFRGSFPRSICSIRPRRARLT